jgi:uncharacterized membrane protein (UPF0127 family)
MLRVKQNSQRAAVLAALLLVAVAALAYRFIIRDEAQRGGTATERLEIVTASGLVRQFEVEVARSSAEQRLGLMYRTALADNRGMLFPHDVPRESSMWMRNTYIPLDMVFIREDGRIHRIEADAEPHSERIITSEGAVSAVVELAGGATRRLGIAAGDLVRHPHFSVADKRSGP